MSVLDTAKAHYQEILAVDPKPLTIPEWGGEFFVRPQISVKKKMFFNLLVFKYIRITYLQMVSTNYLVNYDLISKLCRE